MGIFSAFLASAAEPETAGAVNAPEFLEPVVSFWQPLFDTADAVWAWVMDHRLNLLVFAAGVVVSLLLAWCISFIVRKVILGIAGRTKSEVDDIIVRKIHTPLMFLLTSSGIVCSMKALALSDSADLVMHRIYYSVAVLSIVWGAHRVITVLDEAFKNSVKIGSLDGLMVDLIRRVLKIALWVIAVIFIAQNIFRLNVSTLLAGVGVIGLAVAFAAQNTIANIFGAITIILDKPFTIGDRIQLGGGLSGTVESVGLRSTCLRTLDGTLWYVPNRQIADSALENFAKRPVLKYAFSIGLTYDTEPAKIRRAIEILHEILDVNPLFDMANQPPKIWFTDLKDWSLNISVTLWFQTLDWGAMQDARQEINMAILDRFNAEGINFAFPTSTQYLAGDKAAPVAVKEIK